jgi:hypothetical protein
VTVPLTFAVGMRSFIRSRERRIVLLPQPEGPMKAVTALAFTLSVTSRTASFSP